MRSVYKLTSVNNHWMLSLQGKARIWAGLCDQAPHREPSVINVIKGGGLMEWPPEV